MNDENKNSEQTQKPGQTEELNEKALDGVAGGKSYLESRSNIAGSPTAPPPPPPAKPGT